MSKKFWSLTLPLGALLLLWGCDHSHNKSEKGDLEASPTAIPSPQVSQKVPPRGQKSPLAEASASAPQETDLMKKMGLQVEKGRIILDTEKSKKFFEALGRQLREGLEEGVEKAKQHAPQEEDLGIHIQKNRIEIDVNKTKAFLKGWVKMMEVLGKEINRSLQPLNP